MDGLYTVFICDGEVSELDDLYTNLLRYDGLNWNDSAELVRMSFLQVFQAVIWRQECAEA